jgi:sortase (surface protein transpeptidase)
MPIHIRIPSIGLDSPIVGVGVNTRGEIDVPSGTSNNVGWYEYGTRPGNVGTAVLDAHVFAALKNLYQVSPGADVYVTTKDGQTLHFRVAAIRAYALASLTPAQLFTGKSEHAMNIITCAGSLTRDRSTYDHRLIVYTTLVTD